MTGRIKKTVSIITITLVISLTGCNSVTSPQTSSSPIPTSKPVATTVGDTLTPIFPHLTPTSTINTTSIIPPISIVAPIKNDNPRVKVQCLEVFKQLPDKNLGKGIVVLDSFGTGYSLWNMETGERLSLESNDNFTLANSSVSPSGNLLALEKFESGNNFKSYLAIMDSSGHTIKTLDGEYLQSNNPAWFWLNNQQLIFNITFLYSETLDSNNLQRFLVLNPFTGEQQFLVAKFPNIFDSGTQPTKWDIPWDWSRVAYNSTLSHAVYLGERVIEYSLWDFAKGKAVTSILSLQGHSGSPRWSPDGSKFLMLGFLGDVSNMPNEFIYHLYMIDTAGNMTMLDENLDWNFDGSSWSPSYDGYFWSPSGRYVALFMYQENQTDRLVILDTQTMIFTDYCISFRPVGEFITQSLVWSPNESQLILEDRIAQPGEENRSRLILVDLTKGIAVQVAEDTQAKGWMTLP